MFELKKTRHQVGGALRRGELRDAARRRRGVGPVRPQQGARSPARWPIGPGCCAPPTAACCSWTRSANWAWTSRPCCSRRSRRSASCPWARDREVASDFQLIAGTNRDLRAEVARRALPRGPVRADQPLDLHPARAGAIGPRTSSPTSITWCSRSAAKAAARCASTPRRRRVTSASAQSPRAPWSGSFRDLSASVDAGW